MCKVFDRQPEMCDAGGLNVNRVCGVRTFRFKPRVLVLARELDANGFPSNTLGVFIRIWKKKEREKKNPESSRPFIIMLKLLLFCRCNRSVLFFRAARA